MMDNQHESSCIDPDYIDKDNSIRVKEKCQQKADDNRELTLARIKGIIEQRFDEEVDCKEKELATIDHRIHNVKSSLDKLRAYILAGYFGANELAFPRPASRKKRKQETSRSKIGKDNAFIEMDHCYTVANQLSFCNKEDLTSLIGDLEFDAVKAHSTEFAKADADVAEQNNTQGDQAKAVDGSNNDSNRFYYRRYIVVGNVSKYIAVDKQENNDQSTHKWMVYLRGSKQHPDISDLIKKVWFFLHPSYIPNDVVEVCKPPFQLTRRGWGEFPVRLQIHFCDVRNKPVDVFHQLKLDESYTGLQTLGTENIIELRLHRHTMQQELSRILLQDDTDAVSSLAADETTFEDIETEYVSCSHDLMSEDFPTASAAAESASHNIAEDVIDKKLKTPLLPFVVSEETLISNAVIRFPLFKHKNEEPALWFTASSIHEYGKWPVGKRRASEWQRALEMNRYLEKFHDLQPDLSSLSTKDVLMWCRHHGYTPAELTGSVHAVVNSDFCPFCGKCLPVQQLSNSEVHKRLCHHCASEQVVSVPLTLTELEESKTGEHPFTVPPNTVDGMTVLFEQEMVDVETIQLPSMCHPDINYEDIPSTLELDWIYSTALNINICLDRCLLNGNRKGPLLQAMLYAAMNNFMKDLLRSSYHCATSSSQSLQAIYLTPVHVMNGLQRVQHFDFLTNEGVGVNKDQL